MTSYILKEVLCNKYNRRDEKRFDRSVVFVIQNKNNGNLALFNWIELGKSLCLSLCIFCNKILDFNKKYSIKKILPESYSPR